MRSATLGVILCTALAACGGGGGGAGDAATATDGEPLAAALERCLVSDARDLSDLLVLLQGFLDGEAPPDVRFDLLRGLLRGGVVPWAYDFDADGADDLTGDVWFTDAAGDVTIPVDLADLFGGVADPAALLRDLPDGTTFRITFAIADLFLDRLALGAGEGEFAVTFAGGAPSTASGAGSFTTGDCDFSFSFDDVGVTDLAGAYPVATAAFVAVLGDESVDGALEFDGTATAIARYRNETLEIPLPALGQPVGQIR